MRLRRSTTAAVALLLAATLTGCGGDDEVAAGEKEKAAASSSASPEPLQSPSVAPAQGRTFEGKGYAFTAPKGWKDATASARQANKSIALAAAAQKPDAGGFATNVNVIVNPSGLDGDPGEGQLEQFSTTIADSPALRRLVPKLKVNDPTEVAGQPALNHEGAASRSGVRYYMDQYIAFKDGNAYTITFSFGRRTRPAERDRIAGSVLASWTWADAKKDAGSGSS